MGLTYSYDDDYNENVMNEDYGKGDVVVSQGLSRRSVVSYRLVKSPPSLPHLVVAWYVCQLLNAPERLNRLNSQV